MTPGEVKAPPLEVDEVVKKQTAIFEPNPGPQTEFLESSEEQVLYGGAAVGGKSYAMVADVLRNVNCPGHRGVLLRRTTDELRELKAVAHNLYPQLGKGRNKPKWSEKNSTWTFPSGATIWLTYLDKEQDLSRFQGQAYTWIGFDELTHWPTQVEWDYLYSRLRTTDPEMKGKLYQRATTNPGSRGHAWVKKMFIDPAPPGQAFCATDIETGKQLRWPHDHGDVLKRNKPLFLRRFIPARLKDNPYLFEDGAYEANLMAMGEVNRKKLLDGDWDIIEGAAFSEWNRDIHVIEPFDIPPQWKRFRSCDYGYSSESAVLWFAVAPTNQLIVYRELYTSKVTAADLAGKIYEAEADDNVSYGMLDSSLWHNRGDVGLPLAEQLTLRPKVKWRPSDRSRGSRKAGKNELHRLLQVNPYSKMPGIVFFNNCVETIAQLPALQLDRKDPDDVDTKLRDHGYDALRYGIMSRPRPKLVYDSFDMGNDYRPVDSTFGY